MYIGEAPGKEEDEKSLPFVGNSGRLLRRLVKQVSPEKSEEGVAYSNVVRCMYGPKSWVDSSAPRAAKVCRTYLLDDIKKLKPKVVVPMGTNALRELFRVQEKIGAMRGTVKVEQYGDKEIPTVYTNHPAAALRQPGLASVIRTDFWRAAQIAKHGYEENPPASRLGTAIYIDTLDKLRALVKHVLKKLGGGDVIGLDVESKNLNKRYGNVLATVQIAWDWDYGYVIPYAHPETPWDPDELRVVRKLLRKMFTAVAKFKYWITWNGKTEDMVLRQALGVYPRNAPMLDGSQMLFLIDENRLSLRDSKGKDGLDPFALEQAAIEFLEFRHYTRYEKGTLRKNIMDSKLSEIIPYAAKDAYVTRRLFDVLLAFCEADYVPSMLRLARRLYAPATHTFAVMESNGFLGDIKQTRYLLTDKSPIMGRRAEICNEVKKHPTFQAANNKIIGNKLGSMKTLFKKPWVFDFAKNDHLKTLFFDVMNLESAGGKKKGKDRSTSVDKHFRAEHWDAKQQQGVEEVGIVDEWSELEMMKKTFLVNIMDRIQPGNYEDHQDQRIRPNFGLTDTVTARTNSSKPNMQQVPSASSPVKKAIKDLFTVPPGKAILQGDFMAFEVRWLAITSKDPVLGEMFHKGKKLREQYAKNPTKKLKHLAEFEGDIHRSVASLCFGMAIDKVTDALRKAAKAIVFGLAYGKAVATLAGELKISLREAENLVNAIFGRFKRMRRWFDEIEAFGMKHGYVESAFGRRRRISEYLTENYGEANRRARNSPIQSAASDFAIIGVSILQTAIEAAGKQDSWLLINAVHDSFLLEVPIDEIPQAIELCKQVFTVDAIEYVEKHFKIDFDICPLEVEFELGIRWGSLVKWDFSQPQLKKIIKWLKAGGPSDKKEIDAIKNWCDEPTTKKAV